MLSAHMPREVRNRLYALNLDLFLDREKPMPATFCSLLSMCLDKFYQLPARLLTWRRGLKIELQRCRRRKAAGRSVFCKNSGNELISEEHHKQKERQNRVINHRRRWQQSRMTTNESS